MIKNSLILIGTLCFILGLSQTARACMCSFNSVEGAFAKADVVLVGKVIKITVMKKASVGLLMKESGTLEVLKNPRWEKSVDKVQRVTLQVSEAFKAVTGETIEIITNVYNGGGSCGVRFKEGESYLVYAHKRQPLLSEDEARLPKESWTQEIKLKAEADRFNEKLPFLSTSICSGTEHIRWVKEEVDKLRRIKNGLSNEREQKQVGNHKRVTLWAKPDNSFNPTRDSAAFIIFPCGVD